jgi:FkbM family methyltransferase
MVNLIEATGIKKIPGTVKLYKYIYSKFISKKVFLIDVENHKMYVDGRDMVVSLGLISRGKYENNETKIFMDLIKPGMIVLDVGANIGYYSLVSAKIVGNKGKVYAFEPEPNNFNLLLKNIKVNNYENIIPVNMAASNKNGNAQLFLDKNNFGNQSLASKNVPECRGVIAIKTITLDKYFKDIIKNKNMDIIKMDAQGAEGMVLEGAKNILKKNPIIITEFSPIALKNMGTSPQKMLENIRKLNYKLFIIHEKENIIEEKSIKEIIRFCNKKINPKGFVNLIFKPYNR